jgi:hypothetical protein
MMNSNSDRNRIAARCGALQSKDFGAIKPRREQGSHLGPESRRDLRGRVLGQEARCHERRKTSC